MLTLPNHLLRDCSFTKWLTSREGRVWLTLMGCIDKKNQDNTLCEYTKKNKVVVRISIYNLNKLMGYESADKSNTSRIIKSLAKNKIIIKHNANSSNGAQENVYEVGYVSDESKQEVPYVVDVFNKKLAKNSLNRLNLKISHNPL